MKSKYSLNHLDTYLNLVEHITGETPQELRVTPEFYKWYTNTIIPGIEKSFGAKIKGKREYKGVKLIKKVDVK
jgi:hypothetical protein